MSQDGGIDDMAHYAAGAAKSAEEIASNIDHVRNCTEAAIEQAKGQIGGEVVQGISGGIADICDTAADEIAALRTTLAALQRAIHGAGGTP